MIVAIYTRFSPGNDPEKTSTIEAQIQMCRDLADTNGWYVQTRLIKDLLIVVKNNDFVAAIGTNNFILEFIIALRQPITSC